MAKVIVGVDIGASNDRFALVTMTRDASGHAVVDVRAKRSVSPDEVEEAVIQTVLALHAQLPIDVNIQIALDRSGLGWGPASGIKRRLTELRRQRVLEGRVVTYKAVQIVAGDSVHGDEEEPWKVSVGRDLLVGEALQAIRSGLIDVRNAAGPQAHLLREEAKGLVEKVSVTGKSRVDHQVGKHDDVFMAFCLAFWISSTTGLGGSTSGVAAHPDLALGARSGPEARRGRGMVISPDQIQIASSSGVLQTTRLPWRMGASEQASRRQGFSRRLR